MARESLQSEPEDPAEKRMVLRYAGVCRLCGTDLPARTDAVYDRSTKTVRCVSCEPTAPVVDRGVAGASARREYDKRQADREARVRAKHPRLGGLMLAIKDGPQSTQSWRRGAEGEERIGAMLDQLENVAVLHDRRVPGSRANIDHLVITRRRIWVVDPKRYAGRPELRKEGGLLGPRVETLLVDRRDRTKLVDGMLQQVALVQEAVSDVLVTGALCFVDSDWSLLAIGGFSTRGVDVLYPRLLRKRLKGEVDGEVDVVATCARLATVFKPA